MAQHSRYWSCSKFADWLRGTGKGGPKTSEGWDAWREQAEAKHRIRFWLAEEGLSYLQDVVTWPVRRLYDVKYYINNRWVTGTHRLTSNLKPGQWHEFDTRVLHCLFDELVNYVEIEEAWCLIVWDTEARKRYKPPFYAAGWFRTRVWRCAEAGLERLRWASELTDAEEGSDLPGKPTPQALAAQEIIALYTWWTEVYPNRPDPGDASGWNELYRKRDKGSKRTEEARQKERLALERYSEIEEAYNREEDEMLTRLVKIRRSMWT